VRFGADATFDRGDVEVGAARFPDHRRSFAGPRKLRRWRLEDAIYFFGYALANYAAQPFLLSHAEHLRSGRDDVTVRLAAGWPAHCRVQRFWFAPDGLLLRHDYVAEVIGSWARGAHLTSGWVDASGLLVALERRVVARLGRWATPFTVLRARFDAVEVSG
jgi:hypothetical protein